VSEAELARVALRDLAVEVLVVPQPFASDPFIADTDRVRLAAAWGAGMESLSTHVRVTLAPGSSHMIQWDRPELVIEAVERLVATVRGG